MTTRWGASLSGDGEGSWSDEHDYATWDAAYVLGSLSAADRREFEAHIRDCPSCRCAVAELSGMPALLSKLDHNELAVIDAAGHAGDAPAPSADVLTSLLAKVAWRRRRTRLVAWSCTAAAAVVLAVGVFVGVAAQSPM
ncbi:MAG: anti-sigma factor family protein, partial [Solirubrobacteraceae bacterium]